MMILLTIAEVREAVAEAPITGAYEAIARAQLRKVLKHIQSCGRLDSDGNMRIVISKVGWESLLEEAGLG